MNKKFWFIFLLIVASLILAWFVNYLPDRSVIIILGEVTFVYLLLIKTEYLYYVMMAVTFLPFYAVFGGYHVNIVDTLITACFLVWLVKALMLKWPIRFPRFFLYTIIFLMGIIPSVYAALNVDTSVKEILQYIQLSLLYIIVFFNGIKGVKQIKNMLRIILYSCAVLATFAIIYYLMGSVAALYALGFHKNAMGSFMAICFPLAMINSRKSRTFYDFLVLALISGGLIVSLSRGAWVGAFSSVLITEFIYDKKNFLRNVVIFGLVLFAALLVMPSQFKQQATQSKTINFRKEQWHIAQAGFAQHPLLGVGYGNFLYLSMKMVKVDYERHFDPHNIVLRLAAETGIFGLLGFFILFINIYRYCFQTIGRETDPDLRLWEIGMLGSLIAYLGHGLFDVFWVRGTGSLFWIILSFIVLLTERRKNLKEDPDVQQAIA